MLFKAVQFKAGSLEPTGEVEVYIAKDIKDAVKQCLYTRKLSNGLATVGPSKQVVYSGQFAWSVVPDKERNDANNWLQGKLDTHLV